MGKKFYEVIVNDGTNQYVVGRISGILEAICGDRRDLKRFANGSVEGFNFVIIRVETIGWKFRKARKVIEQLYPKKCVFLS